MAQTEQQRLSIVFVITELEPGGAEKCLCELSVFLSARGHRVEVLSLGPAPTGARSVLLDRLRESNIPIQFGNARGKLDFISVIRWLKRAVGEIQPDIVQSMLWHANVVSAIALRSNSIPLVGGVRVSDPSRMRGWIQGRLAGRFSRLICVSHDVARQCRDREKIADSKLVVIPNGVVVRKPSEPFLSWQTLGLPTDARVLLFLGRLENQKGVEHLMKHADEILVPLDEHYLVLMGRGSQERLLKGIACQAKCRERIRFVGWQTDGPDWIASARLLILPAEYEGMPNVLLEAMERSRAFVAFDVDGVRELLSSAGSDEQKSCQVAPRGDWKGFAKRIVRLARENELRNRIGQLNRDHIHRYFKLSDQLSKYEAVYQEVLSAKQCDTSRSHE